jgi:sugar/nucleoside kinase (ribokinase family)
MKALKPLNTNSFCYNHIVGTGGIGAGIVFSLDGNHTLGRNESRLGELEPFRDYCKQHIIMHYIAILLNAGNNNIFQSFPIGKVGNDNEGKRLKEMMNEAGMNTKFVSVSSESPTLFSVCFQYSDRSGGNITSSNSASNLVNSDDINLFFEDYSLDGKMGIVLAVPEVPVETRIKLLQKGKEFGMFNVGSVLSSEIASFEKQNGFKMTDLLAINIDEAQRIAGIEDKNSESADIVEKCISNLKKMNPQMIVLITDGANGCYCSKENQLEFTPALKTGVVSTAGAGDAFLAGTIAGICCGLPLFKGYSNAESIQSPLQTAVELGTALASLSVTSADTIHEGADAASVYKHIQQAGLTMSDDFSKMFSNN